MTNNNNSLEPICKRCNDTGVIQGKPFIGGEYGQNAPCPECDLGKEIQEMKERGI